jgi:hypothetical protein
MSLFKVFKALLLDIFFTFCKDATQRDTLDRRGFDQHGVKRYIGIMKR